MSQLRKMADADRVVGRRCLPCRTDEWRFTTAVDQHSRAKLAVQALVANTPQPRRGLRERRLRTDTIAGSKGSLCVAHPLLRSGDCAVALTARRKRALDAWPRSYYGASRGPGLFGAARSGLRRGGGKLECQILESFKAVFCRNRRECNYHHFCALDIE